MSARIVFCLAAAFSIAAIGGASAASNQPSVGAAPPSSDASPLGAPAYSQAGTSDPYNQSDFSSEQSFGLVASQMLGAAAACEQLHSDSISLSGMQAAKNAKNTGSNRADIDAAQQNMLDPAATSPGTLKGAVDCDRIGGSFSKLQQIQAHDQYLSKELDQPGATPRPR